MTRLPTPGGDAGQWGQLLNDFLDVEHNADGTLKVRTDGTFYSKPTGGIPSSDLSSAVQTTLSNVGNATKIQGTNVDGSTPSDGEALVYSLTAGPWVPNTITSGGAVPDATTSSKGIVQLAGDLAVTASSPTVPGLTSKATDSAVVHNTGAETVAGVKTFSSSPVVPTPTNTTDAANKSYVDTAASGVLPSQTGNSGKYLTTNGTAASWATVAGGAGGYSFNFVSKTTNYTAANLDYVLADSTSAGVTITLPAAAANAFVRVKRMNTTGNFVAVASPTGFFDQTFSGTDTLNASQYQSQDYLSDGTNWYRV